MASLHEIPRDGSYVGFVNPQSTGHSAAMERLTAIRGHLLHPFHSEHTVDHIPSPLDISSLADEREQVLVYSDGGDGTVRNVVASIIGVVANNPEASAANMAAHKSIAKRLRFFAGAGGNANNWPLSAHGDYAKNPSALTLSDNVSVGYHRPMMYEVIDEAGNIVQSNIATSCIGFSGPAIASDRLQQAKSELKQKSRIPRLISEAQIALGAVRGAPKFTANVSFQSPEHSGNLTVTDVTGLEFIGSRIYAKEGRTQVNVDDTFWQPVVTRRYPNKLYDTAVFTETMARLKLGRHIIRPLDLSDMSISIQIASDAEAVQFHADGETGEDYRVQPGQTLRMHLAQIAIPVIMVA